MPPRLLNKAGSKPARLLTLHQPRRVLDLKGRPQDV